MNANQKLAMGIGVGMLVALSIAGLAKKDGSTGELVAPPLPEPVSPTYGNCRFSFAILDENESLFGKAEFYLKIESTLYPDLKALVPLNVGGEYSGRTNGVVELPFSHAGAADETYYLNLLDEDGLEDEEIEKISELAGATGSVIWQGAQIYAAAQGVPIPISADSIAWLAENSTSATIENLNQHWYDSFGEAEYRVLKNPPESDRDANVLTIVDGEKRKVEVRFHYQRQ